jgi:hypothetical protein
MLDVAIKIYTKHAWTLFKLVAFLVAPGQLIGAFISTSAASPAVARGPGNRILFANPSDLHTYIAATVVVSILGLIVTIIATAGCFKAVSDAYLGETPEVGTSLRYAFRRTGSLLWLTFITIVLVLLGFLACVIPGIWLWISWTVATPALLFEGRKGTKALRRSFNLIKGRWWRTLGALIVSFLIVLVVGSIVGVIFSKTVFHAAEDSFFVRAMLQAVGGTIAGVLTTPFQAALVTIIFFDAKVRNEGFDLQLLAEGIGSTAQIGPAPDFFPPPPGPPPGEAPPFWPPPPGWKPGSSSGE